MVAVPALRWLFPLFTWKRGHPLCQDMGISLRSCFIGYIYFSGATLKEDQKDDPPASGTPALARGKKRGG